MQIYLHQHHPLSSWPVPVTMIETAPSIFLLDVPSAYTDRAPSSFGFEAFVLIVLPLYQHVMPHIFS
jgi:hypothetical protein